MSREQTSPFGLNRLKDTALTYAGPGWGDRCGVFLSRPQFFTTKEQPSLRTVSEPTQRARVGARLDGRRLAGGRDVAGPTAVLLRVAARRRGQHRKPLPLGLGG